MPGSHILLSPVAPVPRPRDSRPLPATENRTTNNVWTWTPWISGPSPQLSVSWSSLWTCELINEAATALGTPLPSSVYQLAGPHPLSLDFRRSVWYNTPPPEQNWKMVRNYPVNHAAVQVAAQRSKYLIMTCFPDPPVIQWPMTGCLNPPRPES